MPRFVILGSGMAGCGAAQRLRAEGLDHIVYDKRSFPGGHTASHQFPEGFTLDEGPHVSFTENQRVKQLFSDNVQQDYAEHHATVNNYWQGCWIKHPVQCNLHGMPPELVVKVIEDFVEARQIVGPSIDNYEQWLRASYGNTFAETFPMKYTKKYHTTEASNLTIDWIGPRLYRPSLEEVLRGALTPNSPDVHYITKFRYPRRGGFVSFIQPLLEQAPLQLNHELVRIDPRANTVYFANGVVDTYDQLISSIPLPALIPLIDGAPDDVCRAAELLACSEVVVVSVGVRRSDPIDAHWSYFYDDDIFFTRLSTPHLQSRSNVPDQCACLMAECYYSDKYRPLDRKPQECIAPVIADLHKCSLLEEGDEIVFRHAMHLKYANVIFDHDRVAALDIVRGYLDDIGITPCGRYGLWAYIWTDQAFLSGDKAAQRVIDQSCRLARGGSR